MSPTRHGAEHGDHSDLVASAVASASQPVEWFTTSNIAQNGTSYSWDEQGKACLINFEPFTEVTFRINDYVSRNKLIKSNMFGLLDKSKAKTLSVSSKFLNPEGDVHFIPRTLFHLYHFYFLHTRFLEPGCVVSIRRIGTKVQVYVDDILVRTLWKMRLSTKKEYSPFLVLNSSIKGIDLLHPPPRENRPAAIAKQIPMSPLTQSMAQLNMGNGNGDVLERRTHLVSYPQKQNSSPQAGQAEPEAESEPPQPSPPNWKTTPSVSVSPTTLRWTDTSNNGMAINLLRFEEITFVIKEVRALAPGSVATSLNVALVDSETFALEDWPLISYDRNLMAKNLVSEPKSGLEVRIYTNKAGKVKLQIGSNTEAQNLFTVEPKRDYYTLFLFNGSVTAIELISSDTREDSASGAKSCTICCSAKVDSVFVSCGHQNTCFECGEDIWYRHGRCPVCRAPIEKVIRFYV